ncbi:MAG: hypothetical protein HY825_16415 [Acidobacteria bacterium]|nr:hypothetical protein [Acidobacteriota bacterium]
MRRPEWVLLVAALAAAIVGSAFLLAARGGAGPSAMSRGPAGLLAARLVLEESGAEVALLDREARGLAADTVLLTAFPWRRGAWDFEARAAREHLNRGGALVLAYSPGPAAQSAEAALLAELGVRTRRVRGEPPLAPLAWRSFVDAEWRVASPGSATGRSTRLRVPHWLPAPPSGSEVLLVGPEATAVAFAFRRGRGTVVVVPAELLSNCRLTESGSVDLLETLRSSLHASWCFDEFHHGLVGTAAVSSARLGPGLGLLAGQLGLLYALAVVVLSRRFGPPWRERTVAAGSPAGFLRGLGVLHDRLGHHADAARLMRSRASELSPRLDFAGRAAEAGTKVDGRALVALGRELAALQSERRVEP